MALKRQYDMTSLFSMASMTDVIFLLLIFFMVTSTFVFPTALEINLPQSSEQTAVKPGARVFVDAGGVTYVSFENSEPQAVATAAELEGFLHHLQQSKPQEFIAVYADESVTYGRLVEILDAGVRAGVKMVLATRPAPSSAQPR